MGESGEENDLMVGEGRMKNKEMCKERKKTKQKKVRIKTSADVNNTSRISEDSPVYEQCLKDFTEGDDDIAACRPVSK